MLNNNEINRLKEYIRNEPDEEVNKYVDSKWESMRLFNKYISALNVVTKVREGKFDKFNIDDKFFRIKDGSYVTTNSIEIDAEEREELIESMLNGSERRIPEAVRKAIDWEEKDFNFTSFVGDEPCHWESEGYSYYLKKERVYKTRDFRIVATRIGSQLDLDIKDYALKINPYFVEEGAEMFNAWWDSFKDTMKFTVEPLDTRQYYSCPEAPNINNNLCRFGKWTSCSAHFNGMGTVARFERKNDDNSFDRLIVGLERGEYC